MTYNRNTFRRILVCATAATLLCTGFAGCSDSNSSDSESGVNIAMEDLEYGATMRDDDSRAVPLEYDKRFLEDGELDALANYYASIQNEDVELFQSCTVEKYMESLYENAYGGLLDDNAYVTQQKESYEKQLSCDIHFSQILVNDCLKQDETGSNAEYLTGMLNELNEDSNYCTDHMESCKTLTYSRYSPTALIQSTATKSPCSSSNWTTSTMSVHKRQHFTKSHAQGNTE